MAAPPNAFVTLLTSDSYLPGALVQAAALRDLHSTQSSPTQVPFQTVCLVTPETVDVSTIKLLRRAFNVVIGVEAISQLSDDNLKLLGRPDLYAVLTKLHVFRLTQYSKVIFLDADVLPVRPLAHLFALTHEFSAVPDVGWPDIFNTGVMVLSPGEDKFNAISGLLNSGGSWDGGDQGILNDWRDGDWNRLSFTYNTTPTAAYTYAPAYERYGSEISAIHFIGQNKPWHSISSRAPGTSSSTFNLQQAYDYESLVDRWYSVYDKHYRSHLVIPKKEFEVRKYTSAWDEPKGPTPELPSLPGPSSGGALSLEHLKRLAVEGMSAAGLLPGHATGEGGYQSLPLEGRFDLMPPKKEVVEQALNTPAKKVTTLLDETPPRMETLLTPKPHELPPTPKLPSLSLPATPTPRPHEFPPLRLPSPPLPAIPSPPAQSQATQPAPPQPTLLQPTPSHLAPSHPAPSEPAPSEPAPPHPAPPQPTPLPQRPSSPPMLSWNPAIEPPPTNTPDPSAFPSDIHVPNIWDQPRDEEHHQMSPNLPEELFQPPPPTEIPEQLLRQGHYRNVTGEDSVGSPSPDRKKVKPMFPWENRPRHLPARVFPDIGSPPPGSLFPPSPTTSPARHGRPPSASPSPLVGMPLNFSYANAWDTVPSIQKYASKLTRPPPHSQLLQPAFEGTTRRRSDSHQSWEGKIEGGSRDGDDEDESDDENDDTSRERLVRKERSGSVSSSYIVKRGKKEYKVRGVQTLAREMRSEGVQVTPALLRAATLQEKSASKRTQQQRTMTSSSGKRLWSPATGSNVLPPLVAMELSLDPDQMAEVSPVFGRSGITSMALASSMDEPSGLSPPRDSSYTQGQPLTQSPEQREQFTTPPQKSKIQYTPVPVRQVSNENDDSSVASPVSSMGPISPQDGQPLSLPRKGGRVWDPARGVELFKRGSEEVLARFLRMGSWEEEAAQL